MLVPETRKRTRPAVRTTSETRLQPDMLETPMNSGTAILPEFYAKATH